jgi:hypothetical protein
VFDFSASSPCRIFFHVTLKKREIVARLITDEQALAHSDKAEDGEAEIARLFSENPRRFSP